MLRVRRIFLRLLGLVYLIAFVSLGAQVDGLIGSRGILPVAPWLEWVKGQVGAQGYWLLPSLAWIDAGDGFLRFLCFGGAALALLVIVELAPAPALGLCWLFYLSLVSVGRVFLGYQWDSLLLETGLLAVFLAPLGLRPRPGAPPSPLAVWLLRVLLFRLMLGSGLVKLLSGDAAWRGLTALRYHYETQPLPTPLGFWAHQLPGWFQTLSAVLMFGVELVVPFFVFGTRRLRQLACGAILGIQALIAATGNYTFFNLLTAALALLLLDDAALPGRPPDSASPAPRGRAWPRGVLWPVALVLGLAGLAEMLGSLGAGFWPLTSLDRALAPLRSVNSYGLFAVMTTSRPEIQVEGSRDGVHWEPYVFRWKPGPLDRAPGFVAPHQPRLDWQMWFAALGTCRQNPWFVEFLERLLEGSPPVLGLLAHDPFPDHPPRFVRAQLYDYHFTSPAELRASGRWWRREALGAYCPVLSLGAESP
jgi:Lipase maturation factor